MTHNGRQSIEYRTRSREEYTGHVKGLVARLFSEGIPGTRKIRGRVRLTDEIERMGQINHFAYFDFLNQPTKAELEKVLQDLAPKDWLFGSGLLGEAMSCYVPEVTVTTEEKNMGWLRRLFGAKGSKRRTVEVQRRYFAVDVYTGERRSHIPTSSMEPDGIKIEYALA